MTKKITIAIDAMGGENAPKKNIKGLNIFLNKNKSNNDFIINLYGNKKILDKELSKLGISNDVVKVIHSESVVSDEETPLKAIKSSKNTSMWNCVKAQIDGSADISLSAGNTGVLLVISRMILKTMKEIIRIQILFTLKVICMFLSLKL